MAIEVKVPVLAESVAEANILSWHKKVGDAVARGDKLVDIETDKVTLEVAAPNGGVLREILKQDGEEVQSDELIATIAEAGEADAEAAAEAPAASAEADASEPEPATAEDDIPPVDESDSATDDQESATPEEMLQLSPTIRNLITQHGLRATDIKRKHPRRITREDILKHLELGDSEVEPQPPESQSTELQSPESQAPESQAPGVQSPAPETKVPQTPPQSEAAPVVTTAPTGGGTPPPTAREETPPDHGRENERRAEERVPMTRLRKRAAERLLSAQRDNALLTTFNEVNMQAVIEVRQHYKKEFEETHGVRLGFMSFFAKATVEALKNFPIINAAVDGETIVYHNYFDIGIAVSSSRGLVVPIVRDVNLLSLAETEAEIAALANKANTGKLTIEELTGGTFTITNGGVFGSLLSTPITNPPQSAILGMHKIQQRPIVEGGKILARPMMYLALTYDHRIIDGREAVQFLVTIKQQIEDPTRLLLQV